MLLLQYIIMTSICAFLMVAKAELPAQLHSANTKATNQPEWKTELEVVTRYPPVGY